MKNNSNNNTFEVKRKRKGYELFLIFYIVLIIVPSIIMSSGENALVNIILSVILLALVLFYYFDKTYDTSVAWGMRAVYTEQEQERNYMNYHRTHFWKETDIMLSYDIRPFLKDKIKEIAVMAKLGSKVRILLLDPESKYVSVIEKACGMKNGEYAYYVLQIQNFILRVEQAAAEDSIVDVQIKYYDGMPLDNMLRAYDVIFAYDNKSGFESGFTSYSYENELNGYNFYSILFNEKWNDPNFCYAKEITANMLKGSIQSYAINDPVSYVI